MSLDRKAFLARTGLALAGAGLGEELRRAEPASAATPPSWEAVRRQFRLAPGLIHLSSFLLASHPAPVRRAIDLHRRGLDRDPERYLHERGPDLEASVLRAAAAYLGANATDIALTDSTTMGLGLLYNGLDLRAGDEVLTSEHDFYATHEALRLGAARTGASVRRVALYDRPNRASADEIVSRLVAAVRPRTRVVALTWVHSSTGVKLPIRTIGAALGDRILLCVDGVHGFGVEDVAVARLGCDFFVSGCHKWLLGPRGTGLVWGRPGAWEAAQPTIPSFGGGAFTPGGFHSFEHRWALAEGFRFHASIGRRRVAAQIHAFASQLKEGLAAMPHVTLHTPRSRRLSAGLVCFEVRGLSPPSVVAALRRHGIVATVTPYAASYARLGPGVVNTPEEVEAALRAIRSLA